MSNIYTEDAHDEYVRTHSRALTHDISAESIERGIAMLDSRIADWRERVDLDALDMADAQACLLGQIYGSLNQGLEALEVASSHADHYGFSIPFNAYEAEALNEKLNDAWREALSK